MEQIVECVPNFSEGKNKKTLEAIAESIKSTAGVKLLSMEPGADTNRTVVTFAGDPESVLAGALNAVRTALSLIDMSKHKGAHPRMGAVDVCPFVPVSGISLEECAELSRRLAKAAAEEFRIPVYLYGAAASRPERVRLPDIRKGEYEALPEKLKDPSFAPDYGPAEFVPRSGALVTGARDFLLAYNVNLNTRDKKHADTLAGILRESGRTVTGPEGNKTKIPGKLKACQAAGWYIEEYGYAQVTANLHDYRVTGLHTFFEEASAEARKIGLRITGSELIGLVPKQAMLDAGRFYLSRQGKSAGVSDKELIHAAVRSLGLCETAPFIPDERIVEYAVMEGKQSFQAEVFRSFLEKTADSTPVPGGGTISAASLSFASALASMAANLTFGKKGLEKEKARMERLGEKAHRIKDEALVLMDADSEAYAGYLSALRLPKASEADKKTREAAMLCAARDCIRVPLTVLSRASELLDSIGELSKRANPATLSDIAVAAAQAETAARGAWYNVLINLPLLTDPAERERYRAEGSGLLKTSAAKAARINRHASSALTGEEK